MRPTRTIAILLPMVRPSILRCASATLAFAIGAAVVTATPNLYNTGQGLAANGATDLNWSYSTSFAGVYSSATTYTHPNYTGGGAFSANSNWIGFTTAPAAQETWFKLDFDLTGYQPSTLSLSFIWSSDNDSDIFLNGNTTSLGFLNYGSGTVPDPYSFQTYRALTVTASEGLIAGQNSLYIRVRNGSQQGAGASPTAARLEFRDFGGEPVPEPFTLALGAAGIGLAITRRRKNSS